MAPAAQFKTVFCFILVMAAHLSAEAAEVRLRDRAVIYGSLVRVSDIAEVAAPDAEQTAMLSAIELMPAPARGQKKIVTARQLQELLELRMADAADLRISGAAAVELTGSSQASAAASPSTATSAPFVAAPSEKLTRDGAVRALEQAIAEYLSTHSTTTVVWNVKVDLTELNIAAFATPGRWSVAGGQHPWTGAQTFFVTTSEGLAKPHVVKAQVAQAAMVAVATRPIERGQRISSADVELQPSRSPQDALGLTRLDDVVGKEALRSIAAGHAIDARSIRPLTLVQARDFVTVVARAGGFDVRTTGQAMQAGALGDVILIESLIERNDGKRNRGATTFPARIVGARQVDVFVQGASVAATPLEKVGAMATPPRTDAVQATPSEPFSRK